jgi:hypothetical protein
MAHSRSVGTFLQADLARSYGVPLLVADLT